MSRFTMDNTEGYTQAQLDELNRRVEAEFGPALPYGSEEPDNREIVASGIERIRADYDTELDAGPEDEAPWAAEADMGELDPATELPGDAEYDAGVETDK